MTIASGAARDAGVDVVHGSSACLRCRLCACDVSVGTSQGHCRAPDLTFRVRPHDVGCFWISLGDRRGNHPGQSFEAADIGLGLLTGAISLERYSAVRWPQFHHGNGKRPSPEACRAHPFRGSHRAAAPRVRESVGRHLCDADAEGHSDSPRSSAVPEVAFQASHVSQRTSSASKFSGRRRTLT